MPEAVAVRIRGLRVSLQGPSGRFTVLRDVDLDMRRGEVTAVVGESGCGKTTLALAVMRHLPGGGRIDAGEVLVAGTDVLRLEPRELREWRGRRLAMVFQDPSAALNPTLRIGHQIAEVLQVHEGLGRRVAAQRAIELLTSVRMPDPAAMSRRYPHELSGGQRQRVVIAMALACRPELLIMDEPTTGLDVSVEAQVLELVRELCAELGTSVLFITHNLALAARFCQRVCVLYSGRVVESGPVGEVLAAPRHPYTRSLVQCLPRDGQTKRRARLETVPGGPPAAGASGNGCVFGQRCPGRRPECAVEPEVVTDGAGREWRCHFPEGHSPDRHFPEAPATPSAARAGQQPDAPPVIAHSGPEVLRIDAVSKRFGRATVCRAVSLAVRRGEILGLVGESGSGKSTLANMILGLVPPDGGRILLDGDELRPTVRRRDRDTVARLKMVFQHPDSTLNPRHRVRGILGRSIRQLDGTVSVDELAARVRLPGEQLDRLPRELSGGLKQRVAIARAIAGSPAVVVCDEPVSALDVSVQASILNLLADVAAEQGLSMLFISHDLAVVRYLADRVAVMYLGEIVEIGDTHEVFSPPHHPYTEALLAASPTLGAPPERTGVRLTGEVPSLADPPAGCRFHTRCPRALGEICATEAPPWQQGPDGHTYRCHIPPAELAVRQTVPASARPGPLPQRRGSSDGEIEPAAGVRRAPDRRADGRPAVAP